MGAQKNRPNESVLFSTHNICLNWCKKIIRIVRIKVRLSGRSTAKHGIMCLSEKKKNKTNADFFPFLELEFCDGRRFPPGIKAKLQAPK